jgi:putative ABC transport system permease protein
MLKNYFKIAWRNIRRHKVTSLINVLGLTLGICACLLIYLITRFELSYENFVPGKERIYRLTGTLPIPGGQKMNTGALPLPAAMAIRKELSGLEAVSGFSIFYYAKVAIPNGDKTAMEFERPKTGTEAYSTIIADPSYFDIFKYKWLAGRAAAALDEPFKVVLTEKQAHRYFGATAPQDMLGKIVVYNDSLKLTVSGIVKDLPANTDFAFRDFISFSTIQHSFLKESYDLNNWGNWGVSQVFVKLAPHVHPARLEAQLPRFAAAHVQNEFRKPQIGIQPLSDIHFNGTYDDQFSRKASLPVLYGLMGIAAFILILAVINFINLSTAQSLQRAKEIGIRKVLGSSRAKLIVQLLCESFLLTLFAVVMAVIVVNPLLRLFRSFMPPGLDFHPSHMDVLSFLMIITLVTSLLAGFYPAKVLSSFLPVLSLKGQGGLQLNQKSLLRKSLIVFQFTVSVVFIIGTMIIGKQVHFLLNADLGFKKEAIITIQTAYSDPVGKITVLAEKIRDLPGVSMVSISGNTPSASRQNGSGMKNDGADKTEVLSQVLTADEKFLPLYEMKILAGRNLGHSDTAREFLINEMASRALGFRKPEDALGHRIVNGFGGQTIPICGVVADFHAQSLHDPILPTFIFSSADYSRTLNIKLLMAGKGADNVKATLAGIEKAWKEIYPDAAFKYRFFDEIIAGFYEKDQKTAQIINAAMTIAIFISCMGLFGLVTFTTEQRVREIGIRKVLGASVSNITFMLCKDFVGLVGISILVASPVAWYFMHKWLEGYPYRISISGWIFLFAGLSAIAIALLTVSFKAIRAAAMNPIKNLRTE